MGKVQNMEYLREVMLDLGPYGIIVYAIIAIFGIFILKAIVLYIISKIMTSDSSYYGQGNYEY